MSLRVRFSPHVETPWRPALFAALASAAVLFHAPASARPVTPRGALSAEERVTIDVFEKAKRSVVYISTSELVRDLWTRNVHSIPRAPGARQADRRSLTTRPSTSSTMRLHCAASA